MELRRRLLLIRRCNVMSVVMGEEDDGIQGGGIHDNTDTGERESDESERLP